MRLRCARRRHFLCLLFYGQKNNVKAIRETFLEQNLPDIGRFLFQTGWKVSLKTLPSGFEGARGTFFL
jgi:hypothetical protein